MNIIVTAKTTKPMVEPCIEYLIFTDGNFNYSHVIASETSYTKTKHGFVATLENVWDLDTEETPDLKNMKLLCAVVFENYPDEEFSIIDKSTTAEVIE